MSSLVNNLIDIVLPEGQLEGTSATLATWLVKVGDKVTIGDPVAELETDKVVMEVCATASGTVHSLTAQLGDEVATEQLLGKIAEGDLSHLDTNHNVIAPTKIENEVAAVSQPSEADLLDAGLLSADLLENSSRQFISPAVRRLVRENELKIDLIPGTGKRGRVTRDDVLAYLKNPQLMTQSTFTQPTFTQPIGKQTVYKQTDQTKSVQAKSVQSVSPFTVDSNRQSRPLVGNKIPHSKMRQSIASHMVESLLKTSPHVTSVFEMDMGNIIEHRKWHKKEYEACAVKLTFTAYFLAAMAKAVQVVPQVNARFHDDALEIFEDVNIGVGTALGDAGLVVPVVEQVQAMSLFEIAQSLNQQTEKARTGKLTPADMRNGSITISNHGVSGSLFAAPIIINQPEVAILGIGKLEKRVVVESVNGVDTMVIRPKCYVSLSIDHRALDAHQTNQFLTEFVSIIENWGQ